MKCVNKLKKFTVLSFLLITNNAFGQIDHQTRINNYIAQYKDWAIQEQQRTGIPAAIKLAQGIHETGAGTSVLSTEANNHFGIKCKSTWTGLTFTHTDDAPDECFRKYENAFQSYQDHSNFLKGNPRYAKLFTLEPTDYKGWAATLKQCGYATNPKYTDRLISIIENNNLQSYTLYALGNLESSELPQLKTSYGENLVQENTKIVEQKEASTVAQNNTTSTTKDTKYFIVNGVKAIHCKKGTPLLDIAIQENIRYAKLLDINDLPDAPVPFDMYIYLQKKPSKGTRSRYVVKEGDNMLSIAQSQAIQLYSLRALNLMADNEEPIAGETIYLQETRNTKPKVTLKSKTDDAYSPSIASTNHTPITYIDKEGNVVVDDRKKVNTVSPNLKATQESKTTKETIVTSSNDKASTNQLEPRMDDLVDVKPLNNQSAIEEPTKTKKVFLTKKEQQSTELKEAKLETKEKAPAVPEHSVNPSANENAHVSLTKLTKTSPDNINKSNETVNAEVKPLEEKVENKIVEKGIAVQQPEKQPTPVPTQTTNIVNNAPKEKRISLLDETPVMAYERAPITRRKDIPEVKRLDESEVVFDPTEGTKVKTNGSNQNQSNNIVKNNEQVVEEPQDEFSRLKSKLDRIVYAQPSNKPTVNQETKPNTVQNNVPTEITGNKNTNPVRVVQNTTKHHIVKKGDTAFSIAKQYGISMKELIDWNNLDFKEMKVGQKLKVQSN